MKIIKPDLQKIDELLLNQNAFRFSECNRKKCIVYFSTKYGICKMNALNILKGCKISILSSIDKTSYFINLANEIHNKKYDYSRVTYINSFSKMEIVCPTHGTFSQTPEKHLIGQGCRKCSEQIVSEKYSTPIEELKNKINEIFGNLYIYDFSNYKNLHSKIKVICKKHGSFEQKAYSHISGHGCKHCSFENNTNFHGAGWTLKDWVKSSGSESNIYLIKIYNKDTNEEFLKVGITKHRINQRFRGRRFPYKYKPIVVLNINSKKAWEMEKQIIKQFKEYKYTPELNFSGCTECFNINIEGKIKALMTQ